MTSLKAKFESNRGIRGNYKGVSIQLMACLVLVDFTRPIARVRKKRTAKPFEKHIWPWRWLKLSGPLGGSHIFCTKLV